ncbi:uncharacterized protein MYCGRDRAFT_67558 [Zymoseptoria tritici IPO323]|uniref:Dienelactone hydrolase domain-containing protein n=1 Tax=Zymoseptoria tritici (strain CBS 115943 / IPO323) TaxID=336722 RepID=F9WX71_ZYMTI|nr:uncharacterized protein MYCGRDRAFT_67558 [Zymoseptoria tritici IPO323]EGP91860.1 hypothetical protein MYCGRDRAFT_67558 [Zymoseptoria tritici IPO323]
MSLKSCCATGSLHTGTPTGRVEKVHGLDCYIADAPNGSSKGVIVIIPDAFGWELPNNRILADDYAKNGFKVLLPEFQAGCGFPIEALTSLKVVSEPGFQLWKITHFFTLARYFVPFLISCRQSVAGPKIYNFLEAVNKNEAKDLPVGVAGFCWGGLWVTKLCSNEVKAQDGSDLIVCGFTAHPSMLTYPNDIEKVVLPYAVAAPEIDPQMSPESAKQTKEILTAKTAKSKDQGVEFEFVMYDGAHHGFAVRADEDDTHEAAQGKKAEAQAVAWFSKWFSSYSG